MRYAFNMVTMMKEKVNTHFSFPLQLNMAPYTEDFLMGDKQEQGTLLNGVMQLDSITNRCSGKEPACRGGMTQQSGGIRAYYACVREQMFAILKAWVLV